VFQMFAKGFARPSKSLRLREWRRQLAERRPQSMLPK